MHAKTRLAEFRQQGQPARKSMGQNFLHDAGICSRIAELALAEPLCGTVLEIGPGLGALTEPLLAKVQVVAIERDKRLAERLRAWAPLGLTLVEADALKVSWLQVLQALPRPYRVVGNLPYSITGALLRLVMHIAPEIDRSVVMVQREVAARMCAQPRTGEYGALSVFLQSLFDVRKAFTVGSGAFWPSPQIESTVVVLTPKKGPKAAPWPVFEACVRQAFGHRRKTLRNTLRGLFGWSVDELAAKAQQADISLDSRAEELSIDEFYALASLAEGGAGASAHGTSKER